MIDDIALLWRCCVQIWTDEEVDSGSIETIWGTKCTRRRRVVESDQRENKAILEKFYDDLFTNMQHANPSIHRQHVKLEKANQLQVYNSLFTTEGGIRCHQASYRKFTESTVTIQNVTSSRAEFEGKRYVLGWPDIPELSSRAYMVSLFSEYASVGGAFHDRLTEKYAGQPPGGDPQVNIHSMLIRHPFVTEPNDTVVSADQTKQKIAGAIQICSGSHSMFAGLSPQIDYPLKDSNGSEYYRFAWPKDGLVKVCALGFTIKVVDQEVAFTQGLGTFIMSGKKKHNTMATQIHARICTIRYDSNNFVDPFLSCLCLFLFRFDVRWQRCSDYASHGAPASTVEVFLENSILINAQSGTEEPLAEPIKHLLITPDGTLFKIVNIDELVDYAIQSAILQRGAGITPEEKQQYSQMLIQTQKATLTKAVQCDLSFIWASWVQLWSNQRRTAGNVSTSNFGVTTVELSQKHASPPSENKKTLSQLIHSVVSNSNTGVGGSNDSTNNSLDSKLKLEREIQVEVATQEESYTTQFEQDTLRPFVASYQKVTHTEIALHAGPNEENNDTNSNSSPVLHHISQVEYKNSRHLFIWSDCPFLSTKDYIQGAYQQYLDTANNAYADLKAEKEGTTRSTR